MTGELKRKRSEEFAKNNNKKKVVKKVSYCESMRNVKKCISSYEQERKQNEEGEKIV